MQYTGNNGFIKNPLSSDQKMLLTLSLKKINIYSGLILSVERTTFTSKYTPLNTTSEANTIANPPSVVKRIAFYFLMACLV